jgi:hypothetical protein
MQEALLANPSTPLDELGVHDGDLAGWPTKTNKAKF